MATEFRLLANDENTVTYKVFDTTGAVVSTATVKLTIVDSTGATLVNNVTMAWNAGNSDYEYVIPALSVPKSLTAVTTITVTVGGILKLTKVYPTLIATDNS